MPSKASILSTLIGACTLIVFALHSTSFAKPKFLEHLRQTYGLNESTKCTVCHDVKRSEKPGKKNLGSFGKAYQDALGKYGKDNLSAIEKSLEDLDTDGDGATNVEEIRLGTLPGDANSVPAKELLERYRKAMAANTKK